MPEYNGRKDSAVTYRKVTFKKSNFKNQSWYNILPKIFGFQPQIIKYSNKYPKILETDHDGFQVFDFANKDFEAVINNVFIQNKLS